MRQDTKPLEEWKSVMIREALAQTYIHDDRSSFPAVRREVAELIGCSDQQVASTGAWLQIYAKRLIGERDIKPEELIKAAAIWCSLNYSDDALEGVLTHLVSESPGDPKTLRELLLAFSEKALGYKSKNQEVDRKSDVPLNSTPTKTTSGDHVDYDFAAKRAWRGEIERFLEQRLPTKGREKLKVLCLPSKNPKTEVEMYLRLGIGPENIVGVEGGDQEARATFETNAHRLGIRPVLGRLEKVLPTITEQFDIVNLDFLGPICFSYVDICRKVNLSDRAWVMINLKAAREQTVIQEALSQRVNQTKAGGAEVDFWRQLYHDSELVRTAGLSEESFRLWKGSSGLSQAETDIPISRSRELVADSALLNAVSSARVHDHSFHAEKLREISESLSLSLEQVWFSAIHQAKALEKAVWGSIARHQMDVRMLPKRYDRGGRLTVGPVPMRAIPKLATDVVWAKPVVNHLERFSYKSTVSGNGALYNSSFAELHRLHRTTGAFRNSVNFLSSALIELVRREHRDGLEKLQLVVHKAPGKTMLTRKASLDLRVGQQSIARVSLKKFLADCYGVLDLYDSDYSIDSPSKQLHLPRKHLG